MTPDEMKAMTAPGACYLCVGGQSHTMHKMMNEPEAVTPEEARRLADEVQGCDFCGMRQGKFADALRSLADQNELLKNTYWHKKIAGLKAELAEAKGQVDQMRQEDAKQFNAFRALQKKLAEVKGQVERLKPDAEKYREVMALKANVSPNEVDEAFDEVAKEQRLEKELAEARASVEDWKRAFDTQQEWRKIAEAERDALQAKYDIAFKGAFEAQRVAMGWEDKYNATLQVAYELHSDVGADEINRRVAAKLTNAADEGKRGTA